MERPRCSNGCVALIDLSLSSVYCVVCFSYEEQGDIEEALENYREILKTDPFSVEAKQGVERCRSLQVKHLPSAEARQSQIRRNWRIILASQMGLNNM